MHMDTGEKWILNLRDRARARETETETETESNPGNLVIVGLFCHHLGAAEGRGGAIACAVK